MAYHYRSGAPGTPQQYPQNHCNATVDVLWWIYRTTQQQGDPMKASSRSQRQTIRTRIRTQRAAQRITRRGNGSLTTHCIAAGLTPREARTVASSLRKAAAKLGITGTAARTHAAGRMRTCTRYTAAQVARAAVIYRPRKASYKDAAARLALAA
jgi:hypothetical protein